MPRNKVLEKAKVSVPSGRNAFDLSQVRNFTSLAGKIELAYCQPFIAGTKGKISRKCFTRTADVVSPAFHRVTEHYDFFVVPIHSLWRQWENWKLNINDLQDTFSVPFDSSVGPVGAPNMNLPANCPRMDFAQLLVNMGYLSSSTFNVFTQDEKARLANDVLRLCDQLRYGVTAACSSSQSTAEVKNILMAAAYQKCYFDHYRRTDYEANNPYAYNLDWLYDGSHNGLLAPAASNLTSQDCYVARELFKIRRVNYRNDFFMNLYPGLNYSAGMMLGNSWSVPSSVVQATGTYSGTATLSNSSGLALVQTSGSNNMRSFSVQSIRAAFALDKLTRASAYAPKHVRDQYKALYGVEGVEDFDMRSERIGSFQSDVNFVEVTNMAASANYGLGDLGAKGLGGDEDKDYLNFYCKYDSIVVGLHYFLPRAVYDSMGIHPWNAKIARDDFYVKAFENLGLRPMYKYVFNDNQSGFTNILGWTVPNYEYKILPDLNFGEFKSYFKYVQNVSGNLSVTQTTNVLNTFVPHSGTMLGQTLSGISAESFKVAPEDLDNLFVAATDIWHKLGVYQFYGSMRIIVMVVKPMSVHGQPSL